MTIASYPRPGKLSPSGEEVGPCLNENCGHDYCEYIRTQTAMRCNHCTEALGYEINFYNIEGHFVHAACFEEWADCRV